MSALCRCGKQFDQTPSGRQTHALLHGHKPTPVTVYTDTGDDTLAARLREAMRPRRQEG